jgi:hypothetical protein
VTRLVCLGGTGDAYLVASLAGAYAKHYGHPPLLVVKSHHATIAEMFGVQFEVDDALVSEAETNLDFQRDYDNRPDGEVFYAHPCFRGGRLDDLTVRPGFPSQADMYRSMMGLSLDAPMAQPALPDTTRHGSRAILVPEAGSWPNDQPAFWLMLANALRDAGWQVVVNDPTWSLAQLLAECAHAALVCGPQCGVMSILCAAEFPCAKALLTPSIDDGPGFPVGQQRLRRTYPYARVTRFMGRDYRVLERRITSDNHVEVAASVLRYAAAGPYDPRPAITVAVELTPGDFLDRMAVLEVKMRRFPPDRRAQVETEYWRSREVLASLTLPTAACEAYNDLVALHESSFDDIERTVRASAADPVVAANHLRVMLKTRADLACGSPFTEVKSYWD